MLTPPFLVVEMGCDQVLPIIIKNLSQRGLKVLLTFNLHSIRSNQQGYSCPHHGTEQCDCQMIVLLIYENREGPITLLLHGSDGRTSFSIDEPPSIITSSENIKSIIQAMNFRNMHASYSLKNS